MSVQKKLIILYNPRIVPEEEAGDTVFVPPLCLLAISSPVLEAGFDVKILDGNFSDDRQISEIDPDSILCIGITAMTGYQIKDGLRFAQKVRRINKEIPIVWGGVHVSLMPEQSIINDNIDIVVVGQGEEAFLDLVKAFEDRKYLGHIEGIIFKENGKVRKNRKRSLVDIRKYPMLPYEIIPMERYMYEVRSKKFRTSGAFNPDKDVFLYYYSSVGCPYACGFCASSKHSERRWIGFSPERVLDEVEVLIKKYGVTFLQMVDAEFFIDIKRALSIAQGFIDRKFKILWKAQIRANILARLTDDELYLLKKSGYIHAEVGVESGSPKMLKYMNKKITVNQIVTSAKKLQNIGILASFIFLFGLPGETKEDIKESFKLAAILKRIMPECLLPIYFYNPYPGVPVYYDSIKLGLKPPESIEAWGRVKFEMKQNCLLAPWITESFVDHCLKVIVFYLPLAFPADIQFGTITQMKWKLAQSKFRLIWFLLNKLALIRVKYQYFETPIEWKLFKGYLNMTKQRSW